MVVDCWLGVGLGGGLLVGGRVGWWIVGWG